MNFIVYLKKLILIIFSPLYFLGKFKKGYIVLMYHRIAEDGSFNLKLTPRINVSLSDFRKQMKFIKERCQPLPLSLMTERIKNHIPPEALYVAVSFDDGYADNFTLGREVLEEYGIKAAIFVSAGYVNDNQLIPYWDRLISYLKQNHDQIVLTGPDGEIQKFNLKTIKDKKKLYSTVVAWNYKNQEFIPQVLKKIEGERNNFLQEKNDFFSWDMLKEALASGNYEVGCHTLTHPVLSLLGDQGRKEIQESKKILEEELRGQVELFSYPFGGSKVITPAVIEEVKKAGFSAAFTNLMGINNGEENPFLIKRIAVGGQEKIWEFKIKLYSANFLAKLINLKHKILKD